MESNQLCQRSFECEVLYVRQWAYIDYIEPKEIAPCVYDGGGENGIEERSCNEYWVGALLGAHVVQGHRSLRQFGLEKRGAFVEANRCLV